VRARSSGSQGLVGQRARESAPPQKRRPRVSPQGRAVIERIDGLNNPTAVNVDEKGAIYIAEVNDVV